MNYLFLSALFSLLTEFSLATYLLLKHRNNKPALVWGILCLGSSCFHVGLLIISSTASLEKSLFGWQIANIGTILGPIIHHHFVCTYLKLKKRSQLFIFYSIGLLLLYINFIHPNQYLGSLIYIFDQFYYPTLTDPKPIYITMYILEYWVLLLYSFYLLIKALLTSRGSEKNRLKYIIIGSGIGWIGGHSCLVTYLNQNIYPYGDILLGIFPLIIAYAIIRHQILNINFVFRKSLIYSISLTIIFLSYILIILGFEKIFQSFIGYKSIVGSVTAAVMIALAFNPIKTKVDYIINKLFYKKTQKEFEEENEMLLKEVGEKEKFKAVATLASGIAHEIKNPLQAIKTFTEYLPQRYTDKKFVNKFSKLVGKEITRIDDLVHQLLDYSKPKKLSIEKINIIKLLDDTVEILSNKMIQQKIELKKGYHPKRTLNLKADPVLMRQAFYNLLINAIEVMPDGGTLCVNVQKKDHQFHIQITDTGPGIKKEDLPHLFDSFFTRKDEGAGLGLAITKTIIDQHKGDMRIQSGINSATVFEITLPL